MQLERLSFIIQVTSLIIVFLYSLFWNNKKHCVIFTVVFMIIVNILAQIVIVDAGPGACFGFLALPCIGLFIVYIIFFVMELFGLKIDVSEKKWEGSLLKKTIRRILGVK